MDEVRPAMTVPDYEIIACCLHTSHSLHMCMDQEQTGKCYVKLCSESLNSTGFSVGNAGMV